jgi:hypothetical protein
MQVFYLCISAHRIIHTSMQAYLLRLLLHRGFCKLPAMRVAEQRTFKHVPMITGCYNFKLPPYNTCIFSLFSKKQVLPTVLLGDAWCFDVCKVQSASLLRGHPTRVEQAPGTCQHSSASLDQSGVRVGNLLVFSIRVSVTKSRLNRFLKIVLLWHSMCYYISK